MFYSFIRLIVGPIIKFIWVDKIIGLENIPKSGPVIVAANHSSYFDFLTLAAIMPRNVYFLAGEVFFIKKRWAWLMKLTNQIEVDRKSEDKSESINKAVEYLKLGRIVGIFPEGTRSSDGKLQKFYSGVARIAIKSNASIIPVGIMGTFEIMSRFDKYPKFKKCVLNIGEILSVVDLKEDEITELVRFKISGLCNN